jgi:hypothetical protein
MVIKIWRAFWKKMAGMKYCDGDTGLYLRELIGAFCMTAACRKTRPRRRYRGRGL